MAQWTGALVALAENPGLDTSTYMAANNPLLQFQEIRRPDMCGTCTPCRQIALHIKNKDNLKIHTTEFRLSPLKVESIKG